MEAQVTGEWVDPGAGKRWTGTKRFQGLGSTTREARFGAAKAALSRLAAAMPGLRVPAGELPPLWHSWAVANLRRGVPPEQILGRLAGKGFVPAANKPTMARMVATAALAALRRLTIAAPGGLALSARYAQWVEGCLRLGLDGAIIAKILEEEAADNDDDATFAASVLPLIGQRLRRGVGPAGVVKGGVIGGVGGGMLDFWQCCARGMAREVQLYLAGGQSPDQMYLHAPRGTACLPLSLAAAGGHSGVMEALLSRGADTNLQALASWGESTVRQLTHGESNRHQGGPEDPIDDDDDDGVGEDRAAQQSRIVPDLLYAAHAALMDARLPPSAPRHFPKAWCAAAAAWVRAQLRSQQRSSTVPLNPPQGTVTKGSVTPLWRALPHVRRSMMELVLRQLDPDPDSGIWVLGRGQGRGADSQEGQGGDDGDSDEGFEESDSSIVTVASAGNGSTSTATGQHASWVPTVAEPEHLVRILRHAFRLAVCDGVSRLGRTALHEAAWANRCDSHFAVISVLSEWHHLDLWRRDLGDRTALDLLITRRNRPGTPSGTTEREAMLQELRLDFLNGVTAQQADEDR
ncbi:hypothetical protein JKP88DRAFT_278577 [Tribonema minus]|uniref:Uncharacterized protein n=1 Tax=Tribonema minus TaxID=303371 RepID=A0A836CCY9_9STRA|nr:hypothetical protein JKP88DRAFT_278577 [Tribonema minus]